MSGIDDELLALFDDGADSKPKPKPKRRNISSDSNSDSDDGGNRGRKAAAGKGGRGKGGKAPPGKRRKRNSDDDSDESESSSSDSSSSSASEAEEDKGEEESSEEFDDGFQDDLMGDEKDRAYLMKLNVLEREQILAERQNKRDAWQERQKVKKLLKEANRQAKITQGAKQQQAKRTSSEKDTRKSRLEELTARRKKTTDKKVSQEKHKAQSKDESSESDSESSPEPQLQSSRKAAAVAALSEKDENDGPVTLNDMNAVRLSRLYMEKWVHLPWFDDVVKGSYVRVGIGKFGGENVYRIAEVVEVVKYHRTYPLEKTLTNKALVLKQGKSKRTFRMEFCSNTLFSEAEFSKWMSQTERPPSLRSLRKKTAELKERKAHVLTPQEVQIMLDEKKKLEGPRNPQMEKIDLEVKLKIAIADNNKEEEERLREELKELEPFLEKATPSKDQKINVDDLNRRAVLEQVQADFAWQQKTKTKEVRENDPFARRPCQPMPLGLLVAKKDASKPAESSPKKDPAGSAAAAAATAAAAAAAPVTNATTPSKSEPVEDDPYSVHNDVDIDLDIDETAAKPISILPRFGGPGSSGTLSSRSAGFPKLKNDRGVY